MRPIQGIPLVNVSTSTLVGEEILYGAHPMALVELWFLVVVDW
jgi:hypothetical protein